MSSGGGGGQEALLRMLQQQLFRSSAAFPMPQTNAVTTAATSLFPSSLPLQPNTVASDSGIAAATQALVWQAMLTQAALTVASQQQVQMQQLSVLQQHFAAQSAVSAAAAGGGVQPAAGSFEEALAKLVAAATSHMLNGAAEAQLEPGEIPKKKLKLPNGINKSVKAKPSNGHVEYSPPSASISSSANTSPPISSAGCTRREGTPLNLSASSLVPLFSSSTRQQEDSEGGSSARRRPPTTDPVLVRVPLDHGWRRQTYIREVSSAGVKGDVVYYAPCGKKITTYSECIRYLQKRQNAHPVVNRELFTFSSKIIVGEFLILRTQSDGEKVMVPISEEEVQAELKKLNDLKTAKINEERERRERPLREKKEALAREREERKEAKRREREEKEREREREREEKRRQEAERVEKKEKEEKEVDGTEERNKRAPVEDLLLEEIRPLPEFHRVDDLQLDGESFAHALMTIEFINNFSDALRIAKSSVPPLASLCSGLSGDSLHCSSVQFCLSTLLSHALRLPQSSKTIPSLGRPLSSFKLDENNQDELLRLFLSTADAPGKELSTRLQQSSFVALSSSTKAAILSCLVNEVVCGEDVTRQIDGHLEDLSRLKGDRWMREGKIRALRSVQEKKRKLDKKGEHRPASRNSEHSEGSRNASPARDKKNFTPGIGQCEILTAEEEEMGVEEIEDLVQELSGEADAFRAQIHQVNSRVRVFPFGEDRFHRLYWQLESCLPVLVESIESGAKHNPACDLSVCCADPPSLSSDADSFTHPDVMGCMEDLLDAVSSGKSEKERRRRGVHAYRKMTNSHKRGWWTVCQDQLDGWRGSLHGRGMRERCLHRLLLRERFTSELHFGELKMEPVTSEMDSAAMEKEKAEKVSLLLTSLEKKIRVAGIDSVGNQERDCKEDRTTLNAALSVSSLQVRLLACEERIHRKYLDLKQMYTSSENGEEGGKEAVESEEDFIATWRNLVASAATHSQVALAAQLLCSLICWELSPSCWLCSVCQHHSSRTPSSAHLVKCTGCSASAHLACVPVAPGERATWKCAKCSLKLQLIAEAGELEEEEAAVAAEEEGPEASAPKVNNRCLKRRAEPGSFVVPPDKVSELGRAMLDEMELQKGVGPFLTPVDLEEVPDYAIIIAKPIDLGTIRSRVDDNWYDSADDFVADMELLFSNCREFNEDSSEIGQAGMSLHKFFTKRWRQLKYNLSKRVKRTQNR